MYDMIYYTLIVIALVLYLWVDGLKLLVDILLAVAFALVMVWVIFVAVCAAVYQIAASIAGPVLRICLRVDTDKLSTKTMLWIARRLEFRWIKKLTTKAETKSKQLREKLDARRN